MSDPSKASAGKRMKSCRRCGERLPADMYSRSSRSADGLQPWCRPCFAEYKRSRAARKEETDERLQVAVAAMQEVRHKGRLDSGTETELEDQLAREVWKLRLEGGLLRKEICKKLNMSIYRVDDLIARARRLAFDSDSREQLRQWALLQYEEHMEEARREGNLTEARLAIGDMLKAAGIVSTGGNTLNVGVMGGSTKFEERIEALLKQEVIDAEVVEDSSPAATSTQALPEVPNQAAAGESS